jgi:hypothetical protein
MKKQKTTKCYAAVDKGCDIVTFYKKMPNMTDDGVFYGDEMFQYTTRDFPQLSFENSPIQAEYDGATGHITLKMR